MKCGNRMCIFEKFEEYTFSGEIEIDWHGLCKNMVIARITGSTLTDAKFYSNLILEHGDYQFDNETGGYICINEEMKRLSQQFGI